jgi:hypothetical protein
LVVSLSERNSQTCLDISWTGGTTGLAKSGFTCGGVKPGKSVSIENVKELHSKDRINSVRVQWNLLRKVEVFIEGGKFTHTKRSWSIAECEVRSSGECRGVQSATNSINELTAKAVGILERDNISAAAT